MLSEAGTGFQAVNDQFFEAEVALPGGVRINGVYTPAYEEYLKPTDEEDIDDEDRVVAAHIFPGGVTDIQ